MSEQRRAGREGRPSPPISSFTKASDEAALEGVVQDLSNDGVRISGSAQDLNIGDEVEVVLVVQGNQKVRYLCEVRHINPEDKFYGLAFKSGPQLERERKEERRRCVRCDREYDAEWRFCGLCGHELVRG